MSLKIKAGQFYSTKYDILTLFSLNAFCTGNGEYHCFEFEADKQLYGKEIGVIEITDIGMYVFNNFFPFTGAEFKPFPHGEQRGAYSLGYEDSVLVYRFAENGQVDDVTYTPINSTEIRVEIKENTILVDQFRCKKLSIFLS